MKIAAGAVELKDEQLSELIDALAEELPRAKVGILGEETVRDDLKTNAQIGVKHEFGTEKLPIRSFLRVPITTKMKKYLKESGAFDEESLENIIREGSLIPWLKKIAILGETIVIDGFDSRGFGKWPKSDMSRKKNHQTLVETQQLRDSITSEFRMIKNAKDTLLDHNSGTLPQVSDGLRNWGQRLKLLKVVKITENYETTEKTIPVDCYGTFQPMSAAQLKMRPEGQRNWPWYVVHTNTALPLVGDDIIKFRDVNYRIVDHNDADLYGVFQYNIVRDYTGAGPSEL